MATHTSEFYFDRFAEFLNVTLAENIARCQLGLNKVQKVRIHLDNDMIWPKSVKVILDNELVANSSNPLNDDASHDIKYMYQTPSNIPKYAQKADQVTDEFIKKAKAIDPEFYRDSWSLRMDGCLPVILKEFAYRNICKNLAAQLKHQGVELSDDFEVQFHNGENYLSYNYDNLIQHAKQQIQFYLSNPKVKQLAAEQCFKHSANQQWFKAL